jgi:hypothetical protein
MSEVGLSIVGWATRFDATGISDEGMLLGDVSLLEK